MTKRVAPQRPREHLPETGHEACVAQVETWTTRVATAATLDDVFA